MSLTAAAIRLMASKGMTAEDIADIAEAMEAPVPQLSPAALRTRKWRAKLEAERHGDISVTHHGDITHVGEPAQVETLTSSLRSEDIPPATPKGVSAPKGAEARGTRLPADWKPDDEGCAYASKLLGPNVDPQNELDRFRDYWRAVPGAKGRKSDWPATWRNWIRRASDNPPRQAHERSHPDAKFAARQANLATHERGADLAARLHREPG